MSVNREIVQLVGFPGGRRRNRWYGNGVSACLSRVEIGPPPRKQPINWDKVLGLATVLVVVALGWTGVGIAVSYILR